MTSIPHDYAERVYAGVLGKLIGVYLGRPFEGWTFQRIMAELGPIDYYVNERRDVALRSHHLVVTDDDISGTFIFPRALADNGYPQDLSAEQIGQAWLNYIVEERSVLWWGGIGNSTEHTAYLRLKSGIPAPQSGSIALNGQSVAEQIGAQIFIDGWAMVSPGNPDQAAYLAEQAGRVSHDGVSVEAAKLLAAMEAQAFVEDDVNKLLDVGLGYVAKESLIRRVIDDVRGWHAGDNAHDWERTRGLIAEKYGYDKFPGNCHVVPNHALIILALLYGQDSFQQTMRIANTAGWDTDCNAGNIGCLFGIRKGLKGIDSGPDYRTPVADRMYISSADGGSAITDAVIEAQALVDAGHALAGMAPPSAPKDGARFHFSMPGSLQGFRSDPATPARILPVQLENVPGHSAKGQRSLAMRFRRLAPGRVARAASPTFFDQDVFTMPIYQLTASPTLYSGQTVRARLSADATNSGPVSVRLVCSVFTAADQLAQIHGEAQSLHAGSDCELTWTIPETHAYPIYEVGIELESRDPLGVDGTLYLDYLGWDGEPDLTLRRPDTESVMWKHAWVNNVSQFQTKWEGLRVTNGEGIGSIAQGTRDWRNYQVSAAIKPLLAKGWGLAARVQGRERYYAVMFDQQDGGRVRLIKRQHHTTDLAIKSFDWKLDRLYEVKIEVVGRRIKAFVDDALIFEADDNTDLPLHGGGVALLVDTGSISCEAVLVIPA